MFRGFISGVIWGLIFTVASLWIVTQLSDVVRLLVAPNEIAERAPADAGAAGTQSVTDSNMPAPATDPAVVTPQSAASITITDPDRTPAPDQNSAQPPVVDETQQLSGQEAADDAAELAGTDESPTDTSTAPQPQAPQTDATPTIEPAPAPQEDAPQVADPQTAVTEPAEPQTQDNATQSVDFSRPQVVETPQSDPVAPAEETEPEPEAQPEPQTQTATAEPQAPAPEPTETAPQPENTDTTAASRANVTINRLPTIGDGSTTTTQDAPETSDDAPEFDENTPPIIRYARPFDNADGLPLMAIVLLSGPTGEIMGDPSELPIALSYAFDASLDGARDVMTAVRASGQEAVGIAPLIDAAQPGDVEVAFADYLARAPEVVALMDLSDGRFQANRAVATQVVANLKDNGLGMITYKRGLNSGLQMAEREGLAHGIVFRDFDGAGQDRAAIKRFLDQAAFRAGQQSGVIMIGRDQPETIAAILEWSLGSRATQVKLAPVSALLQSKTGGQ